MLWMCLRLILPSAKDKLLVIFLESCLPPEGQTTVYCSSWCYRVIEEGSYINVQHIQGFDNLHMLWTCIWMSPYHVMAAFVCQAFRSILNPGYLLRGKPQCIVVVKVKTQSKGLIHLCPTQQGVWQSSYDVVVQMDESIPRYSCSFLPSFVRIFPESWLPPEERIRAYWGVLCYRVIDKVSHINLQHTQLITSITNNYYY